MAKLTDAIAIKLEGVEDIKRLSAALETYNANRPAMQAQYAEAIALYTSATVDAKELRDELASVHNIIKNRTMRIPGNAYKTELLSAVADLVDRDVRRELEPEGPGYAVARLQISELQAALDRARSEISQRGAEIEKLRDEADRAAKTHDDQAHTIRKQRDELEEMRRLLKRAQWDASEATRILQGKRSEPLNPSETLNPLLREVSDVMRTLTGNSATISKLQQDLTRRNVEAEELRRAAEQRDEVIKHLHAEYHELEARKQVVQFELDRAQDEIAAAEQYAAKYKPVVEAMREGAVYAAFGEWARLVSCDVTTDGNPDTVAELSGKFYGGSWKCL